MFVTVKLGVAVGVAVAVAVGVGAGVSVGVGVLVEVGVTVGVKVAQIPSWDCTRRWVSTRNADNHRPPAGHKTVNHTGSNPVAPTGAEQAGDAGNRHPPAGTAPRSPGRGATGDFNCLLVAFHGCGPWVQSDSLT